MKKIDFDAVAPESVGVSSASVLELLKSFDEYRFHTHGIIMAKGDKVFAESYYKPFAPNLLHRMYSVSKTFIAIAVGVAITEGLMGMDDSILAYFPEFKNETTDEYSKACTVRNMLMMRSNISTNVYWWGKFKSRVEAYYSQKTDKIPGTLFTYDSIGCFLLGCIIQKLTGKNFLEYLKEKVLLEIGFSKESYILYEPGGYGVGDSGVMCTTRDLFLFARFIMKGGEWNGKRYVDRSFMEDAIKYQVNNRFEGAFNLYDTRGYGYLIWKTHPDGFSLVGAGTQLAVCDMKNDLCFVITSDNQAKREATHLIYHEFYKRFLPTVQAESLPMDEAAYEELRAYLASRELVFQTGLPTSPVAERVFNQKYVKEKGGLDISAFILTEKCLKIERFGKWHTLEYGLLENKQTRFSFGTRAKADMMGIWEDGEYDCNSSGAWSAEDTFSIMAQITDTYFGCVNIHISFFNDQATMLLKRSGQYVLDGIDGYMIANRERV